MNKPVRYFFPTLLIVSAMFISFSCSRNAEEPELKPLTLSEISGEVLWGRITADSDYLNYSEWPAHAGLQPGQSPHGVWHRVHGNRTLFDVLPLTEAIAPEGSIIVKENFDNNKELRNLTVMAKIEGYDPDYGDWFWAMYQPDGTVLTEGSPGGCISCHEGMRKNDFVIINPLDE
jgi:hypothetical protein